MRIGFIGVGGIAQAHMNNLKTFSDVRLAAVTDVDKDRARRVAADFSAESYDDAREMFEKARLDGVYICVPPFAHGEPEHLAIEYEVPFYVEKPLGIDVAFAEDLAERVAQKGLLTAVGFQLRYIDTVEQLKVKLSGRPLGLVNAHYACPLVPTPWWRKRDLSGGQLVEQVIHVVDLIRYVTGDEYRDIFSREALRIHGEVEGMDIPDVTITSTTFVSGALGNITNTCALPSGWKMGIDVVAQGLAASWNTSRLSVTDDSGTSHIDSAGHDPMALADRAFIDALTAKDQSLVKSDVADALLTQRAVMAAVESARLGQPVTLI